MRYLTMLFPLAVAVLVIFCGHQPTPEEAGEPALEYPAYNGPPLSAPVEEARFLESVQIDGVPHIVQRPDFCGEACAAMYLRKLGQDVDQDYVFDRSGVDPLLARGVVTRELVTALKRIGFDVGDPWIEVTDPQQIHQAFAALHQDLKRGVPSIVCMYYSDDPSATEHFRLVLGYNAATDEVVYHEPAEPGGAYRRMPRLRFLETWPLRYDTPLAIRIPLDPVALEDGRRSTTHTGADFAQHLRALKPRIPAGFNVLIEEPFVVIGNENRQRVERHATGTVRWATRLLKQDYFSKDPTEIIDIWLFGGGPSYRKYAEELFGEKPTTPYGYYSDEDDALVMNIATGGGTLVHEIVHPFVDANFPDCPPWFNEGLGSLYERCTERDGKIWGVTNWRIVGLKQAIRQDQLPTFEQLMAKDSYDFYERDSGTNYGQSRYLCQYLQDNGLLRTYYHAFLNNRLSDPTGYETLKQVLGRDDIDAFQEEWEQWALTLTTGPLR
jgi:hypothetical protein